MRIVADTRQKRKNLRGAYKAGSDRVCIIIVNGRMIYGVADSEKAFEISRAVDFLKTPVVGQIKAEGQNKGFWFPLIKTREE